MILFKIYLVLSTIITILYAGFLVYCWVDDRKNNIKTISKVYIEEVVMYYISLLFISGLFTPVITVIYLFIKLLNKIIDKI